MNSTNINTPHTVASILFGSYKRYKLSAFATRFGYIEFHVLDADVLDETTGKPAIIRQSTNIRKAVAGLPDDDGVEEAIDKMFLELY